MEWFMGMYLTGTVREDIEENMLALLDIEEDMPYTWEDWERKIGKSVYERGAKPKKSNDLMEDTYARLLLQARRTQTRPNMIAQTAWIGDGVTITNAT
jgi:hypothetical protein